MSSTAALAHDGYEPWAPSMVRDKAFSAPRGRRGRAYDADEVDQFVAAMADEIEWLHNRMRMMSTQTTPTVFEVSSTGELSVYDSVDEQAIQIRVAAQEEADRIVAEAESMADDIVAEAQHHADQIAEAQPADEPEPEDDKSPYRIADELPGRIEQWEATGEAIVYDAKRLLQAAQDALSRVAASHERVSHALGRGEPRERQAASRSIVGENDQMIPTPDPPG